MSRGNSSMGGHITPTFGHGGYPPNLGPPLSPNRGLGPSMVAPGMGSLRPFGGMRHHDRRGIFGIGPMGGMGVLGQPGGRYANEHYPTILDPSEFPSLTSRGLEAHQHAIPAKPYGMVKQPASEASAFTMSSEDFPALPGTAPPPPVEPPKQPPPEVEHRGPPPPPPPVDKSIPMGRRGILTAPDGKVRNIPMSMVSDQFGMVGLLTFIRVAESDPNLVSLALGFDLTALGLNLNATESLYPAFGGPWAEGPVRAEDIDFPVPAEYNINDQLREKLSPLKMDRYKDELLFYLFYTYTGDVLQMLAAGELYNRDWRYHKEEKIWITRAPGITAVEKGANFERGTYYFFDPISWRKVGKEFFLEYEKLEERPIVPQAFIHAYLSQT